MKSAAALVIPFIAKVAMAAIPLGVSEWSFDGCESTDASTKCTEYSAKLIIWRFESEVCGTINETTEHKSPDGWFVGRQYREGVLLRFVDSFQSSESDYGWAKVSVSGSGLQWQVVSAPYGGEIHSEVRFERLPEVGQQFITGPQSCSELQRQFSGISIYLK